MPRNDEDDEKRLAMALAAAATPEELVELYLLDDWDVRGAAFNAFQERPADALAQGLLLANSPEPQRRMAACWFLAVGDRNTRHADPVLAKLLDDSESSVIDAALTAYGMLQVDRSGQEFGRRVRAQQDDPSLTPWPEPLPAAIDLNAIAQFASNPEPGLRMDLAMSLLICGDEQATDILMILSADEDEDVRSAAFHSLGWKAYTGGVTHAVVDRLWEGTRDPDLTTRCDAVCALVRLREPGAAARYAAELRAAVESGSGPGRIYPLVNLLYDAVSSCLSEDLREEACRRWAKSLVGIGPPRR